VEIQELLKKEVDEESFFNFFKNSEADAAKEADDDDDEEKGPDVARIEIDFDIARNFLDELIPYSLEYFLGVKAAAEGDDEHFDEEEDDLEEPEEELPKDKKKNIKNQEIKLKKLQEVLVKQNQNVNNNERIFKYIMI